MSYTVVILSKRVENVANCVVAIRQQQPGTRIICVADGISADDRNKVSGIEWLDGVQPFCFARNANVGIRSAGTEDVILCNDDARLATSNGFNELQIASRNYGIVSATILGRCCNPRQRLDQPANIAEPTFLAFVCVYITRETINRLGLLDERFAIGNWEDNDYCRRARQAGIELGVCGACRVTHLEADATFSKQANYRTVLEENRKRFEEKWSIMQTTLSICICSIYSRKHFLDRLMAILTPQLCDRTEVLLAIDAGQVSIGVKRQRLLERARGEFIVFIDDDDTVAPDYVAQIIAASLRNPTADAITYRSKRYEDGAYEADCCYSIKNESNRSHYYVDGFKTYSRWPYHVTPIRRELALKIGFKDKDHQEDSDFAEALRPLLKTEEHIEAFLYFYWWRSNRSAEQTHRRMTGGVK